MNQALEQASRVSDFIELGELMVDDALNRDESCGGHFREEYQTPEGEALRDDADFCLRSCLGVSGRRQTWKTQQRSTRIRERKTDTAFV